MTEATIRIGTRGSALALAQAGLIADRIAAISGESVELVPIKSEGDHNTQSLATVGGTGIFATALREALMAGRCDLLVHSFKDLPTVPYEGLRVGAVPKRADARDALCARDGLGLDTLAARRAGRHRVAPPDRATGARASDLDIVDIRGNVDTRLGRVAGGDLDAVLLAAAGLGRLGRLDAVTELLELSDWPTAPGQGALALEVRQASDPRIDGILAAVNHTASALAATAERAVLAGLEAGCSAPIGATAMVDGELLFLTATVYQPDGAGALTGSHALVLEGPPSARAGLADELGMRVAADLLKQGAGQTTGARRDRMISVRMQKPLVGWRVLVPRGGKWGDDVAATLRSHGAVPVIAPMINFASTADGAALADALARLQAGTFDWIVITSATTVDVLTSQRVPFRNTPRSPRSAKPPGRRWRSPATGWTSSPRTTTRPGD